MNNGTTFLSCALAALAGVCFVTGITLLSDEGGDLDNGPCEETYSND